MPPSLHYVRSAPHACHWHTGCTKRFSSKRQLFLHLGEEHGLQPDAETGGFRATGLGARARRRESRAALSRRPRPRSPVDQRFNALETSSSGDALAQQPQQPQPMQQTQQTQSPQSSQSPQSQQPQQPQQTQQTQSPQSSQSPQSPPFAAPSLTIHGRTILLPPTATATPRRVRRVATAMPRHQGVRFYRKYPFPPFPPLSYPDSDLPDGYALSAGSSSTGSAQLPGGSGRNAATGSNPSGTSADMKPPLVSAPAERPPSGSNGSSTTSAERPPVTAEMPTASSAGRPPSTTCVSRLKGRHFGVSPGPVPVRPPARPRGDVDDDLWVRRPRPWNSWTKDSSSDAANVKF